MQDIFAVCLIAGNDTDVAVTVIFKFIDRYDASLCFIKLQNLIKRHIRTSEAPR